MSVRSTFRMGSVLAASSPNPPPASGGGAQGSTGLVNVPPGFTMPPVSPVPPSPGATAEGGEAENPLSNPGTFEECHRKCKGRVCGACIGVILNSSCICQLFLSFHYWNKFCFSEVFPLQMEGVRLVVNKGLSNHFQVILKACTYTFKMF